MDIAGIVCEFDPFHNGHAHLISKVREQGASGIVCVMSGDFVQRGGPAICDKYLRAEAAVRCGADLVLELPAVYAVNSADRFAKGAVRILKELGCVDTIAFGSESGNADTLLRMAEATAYETEDFSSAVKAGLALGLSYPEAYQRAVREAFKDLDASVLNGPNDILALCYLRENVRQNAGLVPLAVKRAGSGHADLSGTGGFSSARSIRASLASGDCSWCKYVPQAAADIQMLNVITAEDMSLREQRFLAVACHAVMTASDKELKALPEISEGLENRIRSAVNDSASLKELVDGVTSSRYTASRVMRALTQLVLGIDRDIDEYAGKHPVRLKVLAFNSRGSEILRSVKNSGSAAVCSNINNISSSDVLNDPVLSLDLRASDIYSILRGRPAAVFSDRVQVPKLLQI